MSSGTASGGRLERPATTPPGAGIRVRNGNEGLIQEKIGGDEAALDWIHGETSLLKHGETQQEGIPGLPKDHTTGKRFPVHSHRGVTDFTLSPSAISEHERNRTDFLDPETPKELSRNHSQSGTGIRKGRDLP